VLQEKTAFRVANAGRIPKGRKKQKHQKIKKEKGGQTIFLV
jgi:hypothetical protein